MTNPNEIIPNESLKQYLHSVATESVNAMKKLGTYEKISGIAQKRFDESEFYEKAYQTAMKEIHRALESQNDETPYTVSQVDAAIKGAEDRILDKMDSWTKRMALGDAYESVEQAVAMMHDKNTLHELQNLADVATTVVASRNR